MAAEVSQHILEVLRVNTAINLRATHVVTEVIRLPTQSPVRATHVVVEVMRVAAAITGAIRVFPIPAAERTTLTGSGTRVFPVVLG